MKLILIIFFINNMTKILRLNIADDKSIARLLLCRDHEKMMLLRQNNYCYVQITRKLCLYHYKRKIYIYYNARPLSKVTFVLDSWSQMYRFSAFRIGVDSLESERSVDVHQSEAHFSSKARCCRRLAEMGIFVHVDVRPWRSSFPIMQWGKGVRKDGGGRSSWSGYSERRRRYAAQNSAPERRHLVRI